MYRLPYSEVGFGSVGLQRKCRYTHCICIGGEVSLRAEDKGGNLMRMRVEVKNYWRFNPIGGTESEKCKKNSAGKKMCGRWVLRWEGRPGQKTWSKFKLILILQLKGYNECVLFVKRTFQSAGWYLADLSPFKTSRPVNHQVISREHYEKQIFGRGGTR